MKSSDAVLCAPLAAASLFAGVTATSIAHADLPTNVPPPPPLNYADLTKGTLDIPVVRIPAGDPANRIGTLVYNPGGPGQAAGYALLNDNAWLLERRIFSPELLARFDIVGYNPRGPGAPARRRRRDRKWPRECAGSQLVRVAPRNGWSDTVSHRKGYDQRHQGRTVTGGKTVYQA